MGKRYNPVADMGTNGTWTLLQECKQVQELSVHEMVDVLLVKITNSNGLDFVPDGALDDLVNALVTEILSRAEDERSGGGGFMPLSDKVH